MFGSIALFELRYQLRNPVFWVALAVFFLLTFLSVTIENVQIGGGGNVNANSSQFTPKNFRSSMLMAITATAKGAATRKVRSRLRNSRSRVWACSERSCSSRGISL